VSTLPLTTLPYRAIWAADFEYVALPGERPDPVCVVARELRSGRQIRLLRDQLGPTPPYSVDVDVLFVSYEATAELGCHCVLGWPMPARILDLRIEFKHRMNNGQKRGKGFFSLLNCLAFHGLDNIGVTAKREMIELINSGGPWSERERQAILDYCESDVDALARLLPHMLSYIDLPRALLRGRYTAAAARVSHVGTPLNMVNLIS
jgi:DNA polymerase-1